MIMEHNKAHNYLYIKNITKKKVPNDYEGVIRVHLTTIDDIF